MTVTYRPKGTCSSKMIVDVEGDVIRSVQIENGCSGNLQGICRLVAGRPVDEVIDQLEGIRCGRKATSCPDQLAQALREAKGRA